MFIINKRIKMPCEIEIDGNAVKTVDSFRLLGITLDIKLNFTTHCFYLKKVINRKLHSIKRLFYLATHVKIQFFKTLILPYFDYCLSLVIYFPKNSIVFINCLNFVLKFLKGMTMMKKNSWKISCQN